MNKKTTAKLTLAKKTIALLTPGAAQSNLPTTNKTTEIPTQGTTYSTSVTCIYVVD
jgi:hypothetical protein